MHQIVERGYPVAEISQPLGVSTHSLHAWVKKLSKPEPSDSSDEQEFNQFLNYKGGVDLEVKLEEWECTSKFARPHGAFGGYTPYEVLRGKLRATRLMSHGHLQLTPIDWQSPGQQ